MLGNWKRDVRPPEFVPAGSHPGLLVSCGLKPRKSSPQSPNPGHRASHQHPFFWGPHSVEYPLMHARPALSASQVLVSGIDLLSSSLHPHSWHGCPGHWSVLTTLCHPSLHPSHSFLSGLCKWHITTVIVLLRKLPMAFCCHQNKIQAHFHGCGASWLPLLLTSLTAPSLSLLQPLWPLCSWNSPSTFLPQGLCTCHSFQLNASSSRSSHTCFSSFQNVKKCHFSEASLTTVGREQLLL